MMKANVILNGMTEMETTQIQKNKKTFPISVNKIFILQISVSQ